MAQDETVVQHSPSVSLAWIEPMTCRLSDQQATSDLTGSAANAKNLDECVIFKWQNLNNKKKTEGKPVASGTYYFTHGMTYAGHNKILNRVFLH